MNSVEQVAKVIKNELGSSVDAECYKDICSIRFSMLEIDLYIFSTESNVVRLVIPLSNDVNRSLSLPLNKISLVKKMKLDGNDYLVCEINQDCANDPDCVNNHLSALIDSYIRLDSNAPYRMVNNILRIIGEMASRGFPGNEIHNVLVVKYKIPEDISASLIEMFFEVMNDNDKQSDHT